MLQASGCDSTINLTLHIDPTCLGANYCKVYLPNVFSPNNDNKNDIFTVFTNDCVEKITQFQIFDRWGNLVFQQKDLLPNQNQGWNGTFRGQNMNSGVYIYFLEILKKDGNTTNLKGEVMLLR